MECTELNLSTPWGFAPTGHGGEEWDMFRTPCIHYVPMHNTIISIFRINSNREIVTYQPTSTEIVLISYIKSDISWSTKLVVVYI